MVLTCGMVIFCVIAVAADLDNAGVIWLFAGAFVGTLAALTAGSGHQDAAALSGIAAIALVGVSIATFLGYYL